MLEPKLDALRKRIAGPEPLLLIEAPAGYGKTTEAVEAAEALAPSLPDGREVLFLTHTNGARDTFNRRIKGRAAVMKTIHSLAAEIVELYSAPLELPRPLEPFRGNPSFDDMVTLAVQVLRRRPEVALGLAIRHPVILVDEYQDCSLHQHELIQVIAAAAPTRLRLFGDDLQAIFEFAGVPIDWADLSAVHPTVQLVTPWRWRKQPEMGDFLVGARCALAAGEPIDLRKPPSCISVHRWSGPVPEPHQEGHAAECLSALRGCVSDGTIVLTHHNRHALGLRRKLPGSGRYHEGADHEPARKILDQVVNAEGDARALVALLVTVMDTWGQGMTKPYRDQAKEICTAEGVRTGTKRKILRFAELCKALYADPTAAQWLRCLRGVLTGAHGIDGWRVLRGDPLYLLARLRPRVDDDPGALLHVEARARDAIRAAPQNGFMTIHKAKGLEFETVALPYCAGSLFQDNLPSRRRMYVSISRAQSRIHFLVPNEDPTALIRL